MPDRLSAKELAESFGYALSFLKSDDELFQLFRDARRKNWTDMQFQAKLKDTKWFQKHSDVWRQNQELRKSDPGTWDQKVKEARHTLKDVAAAMGADVSGKALRKMASHAIMFGWSKEQIQNKMARHIETVDGTKHFAGEAGDTEDSLRQLSLDFGQKMSQRTLRHWVRGIAKGNLTVNDFEARMRDQAAAAYPAYSEQVKKGLTMRDVAQPYVQMMADTLELNPENIDIFDGTIQDALMHPRADKGGERAFSMHDFQVKLRRDPRWARTKGAQDQAMSITQQVLSDWGMA